jgi:hypothetical protein
MRPGHPSPKTLARFRAIVLGVAFLLASVLARPAGGAPTGGCSSDWSRVPSPQPQADHLILGSVDVRTTGDAWTVGSVVAGGLRAVVEHWDGGSWSNVPIPRASSTRLSDIEAIAGDDVWAVGNRGPSSNYHSHAMHWDGIQWSVVPTPDIGPTSTLNQVEAAAPDDVWAVGRAGGPGVGEHPLALHWDGTSWTERRTGLGMVGELLDVAVVSSTEVWTIQNYRGTSDFDPFRWDGATWEEDTAAPDVQRLDAVPGGPLWGLGAGRTSFHQHAGTWIKRRLAPAPAGHRSFYLDLAVIAPGDVWAGGSVSSEDHYRPAIQRWNGLAWSFVPVPSQGPVTILEAIDAVHARGFSVGYHRDDTNGPMEPFIVTACGI